MQWLKVFVAGIVEVFWVIGITHSTHWYQWLLTLLCIGFSFWMMLSASKYLPVGTVYAVFVGIGTLGTVITGMLFFSEPASIMKIIFILGLVVGVIGLKLTSNEEGAS
ncbi:DMT family transporter [Staphylococcus canis]|uniref:Multidrug efflux SMR transporter n=1 Tax=Staphylococcus canis TaxID=2724942 RepID=A0ABS0T9Z2_9STAP|nr:multidrug efflux SMR transporter [Staphylococcus canis]MBI5974599.1 multidrug efflux SMR transporter [Staphylococcus canis]